MQRGSLEDGIPQEVQEFIFEHIDSIEQIEVMMLLRRTRDRTWTAEQVSNELRTNPTSAANRLSGLLQLEIVEDLGGIPSTYKYNPASPKLEAIVDGLSDAYKTRRQRVYNLIFSTLKSARKFLNAFTTQSKKENKDD